MELLTGIPSVLDMPPMPLGFTQTTDSARNGSFSLVQLCVASQQEYSGWPKLPLPLPIQNPGIEANH